MRRRTLMLGSVGVLATACTARVGRSQPIEPLRPGEKHDPVTLEMWSFHTGPEAAEVEKVLDRLHRDIPWLTVKLAQGRDDFDILQGIYSGKPPDIAVISGPANVGKFCSIEAMPDLGEVARKDGIDLAKLIPPRVLETAAYQGHVCVLPWLTDAYGLFYNKTMFAEEGIAGPPRTLAELERVSKQLTKYDSDGSIQVAGFVPLSTFYHSGTLAKGPTFGADWYVDGKSSVATDPRWAEGLRWQKNFIDSIGYGKLQDFTARIGADSEYTPKHALATGKVAMILDGEWRVLYLDDTDVDYGAAPFPTLDPKLYGSGRIGGTMISLPSAASDPAASWEAVKYLALDTGALNQIANSLKNIPTTYDSLRTSGYAKKPANKTFVDILKNKYSTYKDAVPAGQVDVDLMAAFVQKYESGGVDDLDEGLRQLADDIDTQIKLR